MFTGLKNLLSGTLDDERFEIMNKSRFSEDLKDKKQIQETERYQQFISFKIGEEEYATDILKVYEIMSLRKFTKVPAMPSFIKGVLNLKGMVVPVMDLREKFNISEIQNTRFSVIMIVDVSGRIMGVIIDKVLDIIKINLSEIQPPPRFSAGLKTEFIRGMIKKDSETFTIILDMAKILSDKELDMMDTI
jgi:purine-binding chemotaxis protein CheW